MKQTLRLLFVGNEPSVRAFSAAALQRELPGLCITGVNDAPSLARALAEGDFDVIVTDYGLHWDDSDRVLQTLRARWPDRPVVLFTIGREDEEALRAISRGEEDPHRRWPTSVTFLVAAVKGAVERARLLEAVRESDARFRSVFETASDAIVLADTAGRIVSWNLAAGAIFGYEEAEVLGKPLTVLMPAQYRVRHEQALERFRSTGERRVIGRTVELYGRRKDGSEFPLELSVASWETDRGPCFSGIIRDTTKRKQTEEQLRQSYQQFRALSARVSQIQEEERTTIARELHDQMGQSLTALRMDIAWLEKQLAGHKLGREPLRDRLARMAQLLDTTFGTVHRISSELRPGILDELGLRAALEWQAQEFTQRTGIACRVDSNLEATLLDPAVSTALFRIFQECLRNVARHAGARRVETSLMRDNGCLILQVRDHGRGISEKDIDSPRSLGLLGMRERSHGLGGEVEIHGAAGRGTTVTVTVPLEVSRTVEAVL